MPLLSYREGRWIASPPRGSQRQKNGPSQRIAPIKSDHQKLVTVYLLIDGPAQLKQYVDDLNRVNKVNFNRIIFSFEDPAIVTGFDSLGLMTYDLCGDNPQVCAPIAGAALDLASQVNACYQLA